MTPSASPTPADGSAAAPPSDHRRWAAFVGLAVLVMLAWANGLTGEFTYDDKVEVIGNRTIRGLEDWRSVLGYNVSRPLVILTWAIDYRLWGHDPLGYHVVNVLVHVVNAGLAFLLAEEVCSRAGFSRPFRFGLAAGALWALHPMTTEAVTYVTGRSESLCALFYLGSAVAWLRWRRGCGPFHLILSYLAFLAGMATKEVAVTLPAALVLLELTLPAPRSGSRGAVAAHLAFWATVGAGFLLRKMVYGVFTTDVQLRPVGIQLGTEAEVVLRYLRLWLLPVGQSVFHDHPPASRPFDFWTWAAIATLFAMLLVALAVRRRHPWLTLSIGWFLLTLLPSSSFIALEETMAEHRAYLAGWGVVLAFTCGSGLLLPARRLRRLLWGALVVALGGATHVRNRDWRTEVALWSDAVTHNPASAQAHYGLGDALRFAREFDEAIQAYRKAVRLDPTLLDAWNNLGIALAEQGDAEGAEDTWKSLLEEHPTYCKAHNNLGWLYYRHRSWSQARTEFHTTLRWCPEDAIAHYGLGQIYHGPLRDVEKAVHHYEAVLEVAPEFVHGDRIRKRLLDLTW